MHLTRDDIKFFRRDGKLNVRLMMRPLKSGGKHFRGKKVAIDLEEGGSLLDPVRELWRMVEMDPVPKERRGSTPLFRGSSGAALTVSQVRDVVKMLMRAAGGDPGRFGAHSLRIGGATAGVAAGMAPADVRVWGRWGSDVAEIYMRLSREASTRMASSIGSTPFEDLERGFHSEELEMLPGEQPAAAEDE